MTLEEFTGTSTERQIAGIKKTMKIDFGNNNYFIIERTGYGNNSGRGGNLTQVFKFSMTSYHSGVLKTTRHFANPNQLSNFISEIRIANQNSIVTFS